ncbi:MAG: DUF2520 domain-containing protein [Clostridiales bacterium]|nr:DUF2520 domain-containing protein [Clostridiales bacterium]
MKIGFIGAGKVGGALGLYFQKHGLTVSGYCSRTPESARAAARLTGTRFFASPEALAPACDVVFLTTPDDALPKVDRRVSALLESGRIPSGGIWVHASGACSSGCLAGIQAAGCPVGAMHPLQSFGGPVTGAALLEETFFSIEGTPEALRAIREILNRTGGVFNEIRADRKPLYHAGACVISNYLVTLLDCGMRMMEAAGMDGESLFRAVRPLISGTLKNIEEKGAANALTGPIARADYGTVAMHLKAMEKELPEELEIYRELALKTVSMEEGRRLNREQAEKFRELLKGGGNCNGR